MVSVLQYMEINHGVFYHLWVYLGKYTEVCTFLLLLRSHLHITDTLIKRSSLSHQSKQDKVLTMINLHFLNMMSIACILWIQWLQVMLMKQNHYLPLWQTHQFFNKPFVSLKQLLTIGKAHSFYLLRNEVNFQKYI